MMWFWWCIFLFGKSFFSLFAIKFFCASFFCKILIAIGLHKCEIVWLSPERPYVVRTTYNGFQLNWLNWNCFWQKFSLQFSFGSILFRICHFFCRWVEIRFCFLLSFSECLFFLFFYSGSSLCIQNTEKPAKMQDNFKIQLALNVYFCFVMWLQTIFFSVIKTNKSIVVQIQFPWRIGTCIGQNHSWIKLNFSLNSMP